MGSRKRPLPADRTPDRDPRMGPGEPMDSIALRCRQLTPKQRAEEIALVNRRIDRVVVKGDPHETAYTRALLRQMLLGGGVVTTDTGYLFRASWPIVDDERPISALRVEAAGQIDALAAVAGARIVGEVRYTVAGTQLIAEAPAVPVELSRDGSRVAWGSVMAQADRIRELAARRLTDAQIADVLGCSESAVAKVRAKHRIPPGVGNPTLRGAA